MSNHNILAAGGVLCAVLCATALHAQELPPSRVVEQVTDRSSERMSVSLTLVTDLDRVGRQYLSGESIGLSIQTSAPSHVWVFGKDALGRVKKLAEETVGSNSSKTLQLPVRPPYGDSALHVVATTYAGDLIAGLPEDKRTNGGGTGLDLSFDELTSHLGTLVAQNPHDRWIVNEEHFSVVRQRARPGVDRFPTLPLSDPDFDLQVSIDDSDGYRQGDPLALTVISAKPCRATMLSYDLDGAWMLHSPDGWGPRRTVLEKGTNQVSEVGGFDAVQAIGRNPGQYRLLVLCSTPGDDHQNIYDMHLMREFIRNVAKDRISERLPVYTVIDRVFTQYSPELTDLSWAIGEFTIVDF